jgi:hypothetical protein
MILSQAKAGYALNDRQALARPLQELQLSVIMRRRDVPVSHDP